MGSSLVALSLVMRVKSRHMATTSRPPSLEMTAISEEENTATLCAHNEQEPTTTDWQGVMWIPVLLLSRIVTAVSDKKNNENPIPSMVFCHLHQNLEQWQVTVCCRALFQLDLLNNITVKCTVKIFTYSNVSAYIVSRKKVPLYSCLKLCQMLTANWFSKLS